MKMKNLYSIVAMIIALCSFTSCKDHCKDVDCGKGVYHEGFCLCNDGYEGNNCELLSREKMLGTYVGTLNLLGKPMEENVIATIAAPTGKDLESKIEITYKSTTIEKLCTVKSGNSFKYAFDDGITAYTIIGKFYDNELTFTEETVKEGKVTRSCTFIGKRQ